MKKLMTLITVFTLLLILNTGCGTMMYTTSTSNYDEPRNSFSDLDYYGQWINVPRLGNVWRPNSGYDWSPYNTGQWELTDRGWMWFSDEPYGWIVYHYGNWAFTDSDGWVWSPGYEWSPARVSWISQDDYIGWAPLPPQGWNLPSAYDRNGSRVWRIVHQRDFDNREVNKYRISNNTFNDRRNWRMNNVPDPERIRHATGRNIEPVNTQSDNVRGGKRDLTRVRVIKPNRQEDNPSQERNNQINIPRQPTPPGRSDNGERKINYPPQNIPPQKPKDEKIERKLPDEIPVVRPTEMERQPIEQVIEKKRESQPPVIKNENAARSKTRVILKEDSVRTKLPSIIKHDAIKENLPVQDNRQKGNKENDLKKQKLEEQKIKRKDAKKVIKDDKEKGADEIDKRK
ncbi:MAG: hypothetical protein CVV24_04690 [Ignavibacteriae bacterium HGW-Ignavibacteriae-3]|nr:MAG: hypothetical protein CVV24_04690 [Ignavibacteriae bacterium HGW-Ignavibacteriae-3]